MSEGKSGISPRSRILHLTFKETYIFFYYLVHHKEESFSSVSLQIALTCRRVVHKSEMLPALIVAILQQSLGKHIDLSNGMMKHNFKL